ncbi:TPA: Crp/Fnr family transcriptional regulator [Escherichia coli]|nr:Crp/Fnr family transcriptional regulator [Escherichia coli]HEL8044482.1 Crp/Fnr family transcriptional regulator [Escherichia coli]HEL8049281.1 Crp/Fnr family transcriptional regulator [Escherichia coli]HEL8054030.1 Crp/Fnr family transcriptional regulator [Escherichia coli]HEL8058921.1 Crp/Fnr family transcriptional regulator [Escherichia coli]
MPDINVYSTSLPVQIPQTNMPLSAENTDSHIPEFPLHSFSHHAMLHFSTRETGSKIYFQGEPVCGFWYLNYGVIGLYHTLENGKELLVRVCRQGNWFGYLGLFGSESYHCYARILQTVSLCHVIPNSNNDFLRHYPQFTHFLLNQIVANLSDAEHRMTWITRYRTRHRVLSSIWYLTSYFPDYDWTWREVAEFAGCETETALRFSKELRLAGILEGSQSRLHVCHPEQLAALLAAV